MLHEYEIVALALAATSASFDARWSRVTATVSIARPPEARGLRRATPAARLLQARRCSNPLHARKARLAVRTCRALWHQCGAAAAETVGDAAACRVRYGGRVKLRRPLGALHRARHRRPRCLASVGGAPPSAPASAFMRPALVGHGRPGFPSRTSSRRSSPSSSASSSRRSRVEAPFAVDLGWTRSTSRDGREDRAAEFNVDCPTIAPARSTEPQRRRARTRCHRRRRPKRGRDAAVGEAQRGPRRPRAPRAACPDGPVARAVVGSRAVPGAGYCALRRCPRRALPPISLVSYSCTALARRRGA